MPDVLPPTMAVPWLDVIFLVVSAVVPSPTPGNSTKPAQGTQTDCLCWLDPSMLITLQ